MQRTQDIYMYNRTIWTVIIRNKVRTDRPTNAFDLVRNDCFIFVLTFRRKITIINYKRNGHRSIFILLTVTVRLHRLNLFKGPMSLRQRRRFLFGSTTVTDAVPAVTAEFNIATYYIIRLLKPHGDYVPVVQFVEVTRWTLEPVVGHQRVRRPAHHQDLWHHVQKHCPHPWWQSMGRRRPAGSDLSLVITV